VRDIPIHPDVLTAGFLEFVRSRGRGPLFYRHDPARDPKKTHPAKGQAADPLGKWIRAQGFSDITKKPNHAFRHYWKTRAHQCGVDPLTADFIQGHKIPGEAARYRHLEADRQALLAAIAKVPVPAPREIAMNPNRDLSKTGEGSYIV
jgi:integrase